MDGRLFDTGVLLWFLAGDKRLPRAIRAQIEDTQTPRYLSIASAWEVAIKISLGKLDFEGGAEEFWHLFIDGGFNELPPTIATMSIVQSLPFYHRDPFDRILIATAHQYGVKLVSSDKTLAQYSS